MTRREGRRDQARVLGLVGSGLGVAGAVTMAVFVLSVEQGYEGWPVFLVSYALPFVVAGGVAMLSAGPRRRGALFGIAGGGLVLSLLHLSGAPYALLPGSGVLLAAAVSDEPGLIAETMAWAAGFFVTTAGWLLVHFLTGTHLPAATSAVVWGVAMVLLAWPRGHRAQEAS